MYRVVLWQTDNDSAVISAAQQRPLAIGSNGNGMQAGVGDPRILCRAKALVYGAPIGKRPVLHLLTTGADGALAVTGRLVNGRREFGEVDSEINAP